MAEFGSEDAPESMGFGFRDGFGRDGLGRDGLDRDGLGRDGLGRDGPGRDGLGRDRLDRAGLGRDGLGRDGSGRDELGRDRLDRDRFGEGIGEKICPNSVPSRHVCNADENERHALYLEREDLPRHRYTLRIVLRL